jgi:hypothetical protein
MCSAPLVPKVFGPRSSHWDKRCRFVLLFSWRDEESSEDIYFCNIRSINKEWIAQYNNRHNLRRFSCTALLHRTAWWTKESENDFCSKLSCLNLVSVSVEAGSCSSSIGVEWSVPFHLVSLLPHGQRGSTVQSCRTRAVYLPLLLAPLYWELKVLRATFILLNNHPSFLSWRAFLFLWQISFKFRPLRHYFDNLKQFLIGRQWNNLLAWCFIFICGRSFRCYCCYCFYVHVWCFLKTKNLHHFIIL